MAVYRILHVTASYKPSYVYGGPIYAISALCEALAKDGSSVSVLTTTANGTSELDLNPGTEYNLDGVQVRYYRRWTKDHSHFSPGLFATLFRECARYDIIHIHSWWNLVSMISLMLCLMRGVRPVLTLRGTLSGHTFSHNHSRVKQLFHSFFGRKLLSRALIHVTSQKEANETKLVVPEAKLVVIPNLLQLPILDISPSTTSHGKLNLLFLGRIHPVKNLELLLESLLITGNEFPYSLDIVGSGEKEYVELLKLKYAGLTDIHWVGEKQGEEKIQHIDKADILVLLSHTENFGNVILEALSRGTAVIVSEFVGLSDYVQMNKLGWVISSEVTELTSILSLVANQREGILDIRKRAPQLIERDFGRKAILESYMNMYNHIGDTKSQNVV